MRSGTLTTGPWKILEQIENATEVCDHLQVWEPEVTVDVGSSGTNIGVSGYSHPLITIESI